MNKLLLIIVFVASSFIGFAQQESHFTQFMYNKVMVNPAAAGERGQSSLTAIYRNQWLGFPGSPETKLISFSAPLANNRVGLGLVLANQTIGIMDSWTGTMAYSYHIKIEDKASIRLGLNGSLKYLGIDFSDPSVITYQGNDPAIMNAEETSQYKGNFGAGIYLELKDFYFGVSVPHFYPNTIGFNELGADFKIAEDRAHIYGMAGALIPVSKMVSLKPALLTKYVKGAPFDVDANLSLVFDNRFSAGVSYRFGGDGNGDSVDFLLFYQFNNFGLGAAYDYTLSELTEHNSGSIEALLRYDFKKERRELANPRFFF